MTNDPVYKLTRGNRFKGKTTRDAWGVTIVWPEEQLFAFPSEIDKVCTDITQWREQVKVPDLIATCGDPALWEEARETAEQYRAEGKLVTAYMFDMPKTTAIIQGCIVILCALWLSVCGIVL